MKTSLIMMIIIAALLCISPSNAGCPYTPSDSSSTSSTNTNSFSMKSSGNSVKTNNWPGPGSTISSDYGSSDYTKTKDFQKIDWASLLNYKPGAGSSSYSKNPILNRMVNDFRKGLEKLAQMSPNDPDLDEQIANLELLFDYIEWVAFLSGMTWEQFDDLHDELDDFYLDECDGYPGYLDYIT